MHVDFKITTWERVEIPEEHKEEILEKVKTGEITSAIDLIDYQPDGSDEILDLGCEKMPDFDEQMTPEENGGTSTIEVYDDTQDDGKEQIYGNGKE